MALQMSPGLTARFERLQNAYPVKRSALIPMLMYAQDEFGYISDEVIAEIAARLELRIVQVQETLEYYSMLHRKPIGKYHVQVCTNVACMLRGGNELLDRAKKRLEIGHKEVTKDGVFSLEEVECIGACTGAPAMQINYDFYENLTPLTFDRLIQELDYGRKAEPVPVISGALHERQPGEIPVISKRWGIENSTKIDVFLQNGGYQALEKALKQMTPESIIDEMKKLNLRGRGGAGFPTGMKWSFVPKDSPKAKYVICNADESEPGTCKDRLILEHDPHSVIEGVMIAGLAVNAESAYIYIRGEYRYLTIIMQKAIRDAYAKGFLGKNIFGSGKTFNVYWHGGAGAYEVGEESALMESLEGKRGIPRIRPPFPAVVGLWGGPTVINNAETLASVPHIVLGGADWYAKLGTRKNGGTRLFCLSGNIAKPGVYELPMGYNLKKMIYEVGGGIPNGRQLKAVVPGGSSCPCLTADEIDVAMDFDSVQKAGSMLGSGGVVIVDDAQCIVKFALRTMKFYQHESCGWCIPCREGTDWLKKTLIRFHAGGGVEKDIDNKQDLSEKMLGRTFCPLGDAAAMPTIAFVKKFRKEFEDHLEGRSCPFEKQGVAEPVLQSRY